MIEMLRSSDRLSPEQIGQVIDNLNGVLADYVSQSHLPEEDKILISAAWAVLSSNEDMCRCHACKDTGFARFPDFNHGELAMHCFYSCEGVANGTWSEAIAILEDIWFRTRDEDAQRQVAEKTDMTLKALGVEMELETYCRCSKGSCIAFCSNIPCPPDCYGRWWP